MHVGVIGFSAFTKLPKVFNLESLISDWQVCGLFPATKCFSFGVSDVIVRWICILEQQWSWSHRMNSTMWWLCRYSDCPHCFWTGYFTSRSALKGYVRKLSGFLQVRSSLSNPSYTISFHHALFVYWCWLMSNILCQRFLSTLILTHNFSFGQRTLF